jgi:hypothetical protein
MLPNTAFFPLPGLKKILLVGKSIHPLTNLIKPSPTGDKSYFFAYELIDFVITNVCIFLFLNMFFQVFKDDILELPSSLIEKVNDIPGILCDCKSGNTVRNYYYGFLRWTKWTKLQGF